MKTLQVYQFLKDKVKFIYQKLKLFKHKKTIGRKLKISMRGLAKWGYSGKGLFYGLKLYLTLVFLFCYTLFKQVCYEINKENPIVRQLIKLFSAISAGKGS